jgi:hypothetical protein
MTTNICGYDMDGFMLDIRSDVNILPKKSLETTGKPKLVWSSIQLLISQPIQDLPHRSIGVGGGEYRRSKKQFQL